MLGKDFRQRQLFFALLLCIGHVNLMVHYQLINNILVGHSLTVAKWNVQKAVIMDMVQAIWQWQEEGDAIILMMDLNGDVRDLELTQPFLDLGLLEVLTTLYGRQVPATHQQSSLPIDGIFVSAHLALFVSNGYLPFGDGVPSNQEDVWLDLPMEVFCPLACDCLVPLKTWHLKWQDPWVMTKHNTLLKNQFAAAQHTPMADATTAGHI